MVNKKRLLQVAHNSEWALAKFFNALRHPWIAERFELKSVCGIEHTVEEAIESLAKGIYARAEMLKNSGFRAGNREDEIKSALELIKGLSSGRIRYYHVNGNCTLPEEAYKDADTMVIHSRNPTHLGYIRSGIRANLDIICEKPLCPVIDCCGYPDENELNKLKIIVPEGIAAGRTLMDGEHYSFKRPAVIFYEHLGEILDNKKIKRVEGEILEKDDPDFWRIKEILSSSNMTGIMGDTMCHLLAFISNLGGVADPVSREYDCYKGYPVDTQDKVNYNLYGGLFTKDASATLEVGKFIDKEKVPRTKESKMIKFILEDDSEVILDFREGSVRKKKGSQEREFTSKHMTDTNEYIQSLGVFHESIVNKSIPLTDMARSITTLTAIYKSYKLQLDKNISSGVYEK